MRFLTKETRKSYDLWTPGVFLYKQLNNEDFPSVPSVPTGGVQCHVGVVREELNVVNKKILRVFFSPVLLIVVEH